MTNKPEIIELFQSSDFKVLDTNMINELLKKSKVIGEGATSNVYRVINCFTQKGYLCLKVLKRIIFKIDTELNDSKTTKKKLIWNDDDDEDDTTDQEKVDEIEIDFDKVKKLYAEYELLSMLNHPNIIKSYGFYFGDRTHNPAILLEYCKFNLEQVIKELEDFELVGILYEICSALKYLHEKKIIHRDIKMVNILINTKKHVKICDFGISKYTDLTTYTTFTHGVGTIAFMAPELFDQTSKYSEKVDVYSFGVVMYYVVTKGDMPMISPSARENYQLPNEINRFSQKIIKSCWSVDPNERPSFDKILKLMDSNNYILINGIESKIPQLKKHLGI